MPLLVIAFMVWVMVKAYKDGNAKAERDSMARAERMSQDLRAQMAIDAEKKQIAEWYR